MLISATDSAHHQKSKFVHYNIGTPNDGWLEMHVGYTLTTMSTFFDTMWDLSPAELEHGWNIHKCEHCMFVQCHIKHFHVCLNVLLWTQTLNPRCCRQTGLNAQELLRLVLPACSYHMEVRRTAGCSDGDGTFHVSYVTCCLFDSVHRFWRFSCTVVEFSARLNWHGFPQSGIVYMYSNNHRLRTGNYIYHGTDYTESVSYERAKIRRQFKPVTPDLYPWSLRYAKHIRARPGA